MSISPSRIKSLYLLAQFLVSVARIPLNNSERLSSSLLEALFQLSALSFSQIGLSVTPLLKLIQREFLGYVTVYNSLVRL